MSNSSIEKLEEKINRIVQHMDSLGEGSQALEHANAELKNELEERDRLIMALEARCEQYESKSFKAESNLRNVEEMKDKISSLLEKLDRLDSML